jgi:hypothetical protein
VKAFLLILWTYAVCWVFSALIHVVDADVGGVEGLAEGPVLLSASLVALLFTVVAWLAILSHRRGGWRHFVVVVAGQAAAMGVFVGLAGAGNPGVVPMAVGAGVLFGLAIVVAAVLPIRFGRRAG